MIETTKAVKIINEAMNRAAKLISMVELDPQYATITNWKEISLCQIKNVIKLLGTDYNVEDHNTIKQRNEEGIEFDFAITKTNPGIGWCSIDYTKWYNGSFHMAITDPTTRYYVTYADYKDRADGELFRIEACHFKDMNRKIFVAKKLLNYNKL